MGKASGAAKAHDGELHRKAPLLSISLDAHRGQTSNGEALARSTSATFSPSS
jgi:hypothetical protein